MRVRQIDISPSLSLKGGGEGEMLDLKTGRLRLKYSFYFICSMIAFQRRQSVTDKFLLHIMR